VVLGLCVAACATPGCGRGQPQPVKLLPVAGKVTVEGRPLAEGSVVFWPDPAKGNRGQEPSTGATDAKGNYALYTAWQRGVPPGWYKALVFPMPLSSSERVPKRAPEGLEESAVAPRYMNLATTPLSLEVTESPAEEAYHLRLTR
jgi:hypothetical protein